MADKLSEIKLQITSLTNVGHKTLAAGSADEASETFRHVCALAQQTNDDFMKRGCFFNLGACYVASGKPKLGIKYLENAIPPDNVEDGLENFADLWFNIGVANHAIGNIDKAIIAYVKAQLSYHELDTNRLEGECLSKLAVCYHLKQRLKDSHDMYIQAQRLYDTMGDKNNQALCLVSATGVLSEIGDIEGCAKLLDQLLDVCQDIDDKHLQAKIYHDIGLLYISEKLYESAAECFEQALKCMEHAVIEDKSLKATIMQNIGAACNYLMFYDRAIDFHQYAADIYGEIGDRRAQTRVFCNLAFAHTQKEHYTEAMTSFQHAIQAAKDCGDKESQCLATEAVAAIHFRQKNYEKAIFFYKETLSLLALTDDKNTRHSDRIVDKLADALQSSLLGDVKSEGLISADARPLSSKIRRSRPRISREHTQHSLIAKGLEEISSVEDSSDQDSDESSDENDRKQPRGSAYTIPNKTNQVRYVDQERYEQQRHVNEEYSEEEDHQPNGLFSTKPALSSSRTYEQPKNPHDEVPRADKEYYLAMVAQQQVEKQAKMPKIDDRKESSKMCSIM